MCVLWSKIQITILLIQIQTIKGVGVICATHEKNEKWSMFFVLPFSLNPSSQTLFIIISNKFRDNSQHFHFMDFKIVYVGFVNTSFLYGIGLHLVYCLVISPTYVIKWRSWHASVPDINKYFFIRKLKLFMWKPHNFITLAWKLYDARQLFRWFWNNRFPFIQCQLFIELWRFYPSDSVSASILCGHNRIYYIYYVYYFELNTIKSHDYDDSKSLHFLPVHLYLSISLLSQCIYVNGFI